MATDGLQVADAMVAQLQKLGQAAP